MLTKKNRYLAPAQEAIVYERKSFELGGHFYGAFTGEPSEEVDKRWNELLQCKKDQVFYVFLFILTGLI